MRPWCSAIVRPQSFSIGWLFVLAGTGTKFNVRNLAPVAQLDRAPDYGSGGWEFLSPGVPLVPKLYRKLSKDAASKVLLL